MNRTLGFGAAAAEGATSSMVVGSASNEIIYGRTDVFMFSRQCDIRDETPFEFICPQN